MDYSDKLKMIRKKLNISQTELAKLLTVDYSTVSRIERKVFNPSYELIKKINQLCGEKDIDSNDGFSLVIDNNDTDNVVEDVAFIIHQSFSTANKTVNYLLVQRNWRIGKRINEEIITSRKEDYGKSLIRELSKTLTERFGRGFEQRNLYYYLDFFKKFPKILHSLSSKSFLSWTHYRILLQIENKEEREWYASECVQEAWNVRTLQRNISSQYFRRIVSSSRKAEVHGEMVALNQQNQFMVQDYIKDPMVLEFLGLGEDNRFLESDLEQSIITHLQKFLMELGKGYAFVARQQRIHTDKQDYFIDLVFYNYILKCFVLIDLKTEKITYQDVGQMDMYIKMYDEFKRNELDNPTLGIVLTSDTDEDIAKYSILHGNEQLFASKYKLFLPSDEELRAEIERQKIFYQLKSK